jgi:hypothetical protein
VRLWVLAAALLVSVPLCAQDKEGAKKKKKTTATAPAHKQASKEQIRKFNELEKKQQK